jgi:hypothetical protein
MRCRLRPAYCALAAVVTTLALACGDADTGLVARSFDRPGAVVFTCYDREEQALVPLGPDCGETGNNVRFAMIALVTQTGRGEVASVDLAAGRVLDVSAGVPGFTFIPVLPVPTGIALRPDRPAYTYVASFGARKVQAVPTDRFVPGAQPTGGEEHDVALPGPPTDLVLGPAGDALYVAVPELWGGFEGPDAGVVDAGVDGGMDAGGGADGGGDAGGASDGGIDGSAPEGGGAVFRIPLDEEGRLGAPERIHLLPVADVLRPSLGDLASLPPSADVTEYELACAPTPRPPPAPPADMPPPADPGPALSSARPVALAVDAIGGVVLVADETLPVVHRINVSASPPVVLPPIAVGVPTRRLAVTPPVPARPGTDTPEARYLYAIDRRDGSILVVDYTPGSPSEGAVLPVTGAGLRPDRIPAITGARALAVLSPGYAAAASPPGVRCAPGSDLAEAAAPLHLRGVFVAAGLADGSLRIVDVHDLDLECRGFPGCAGVFEAQSVFLRRHSARIVQSDAIPFVLAASPLFRFGGVSARVLEDGTMESGDAPGLVPFDVCPGGMGPAYPPLASEETPLVCQLEDAWAARGQRWTATWEGTVPGAAVFHGVLGADGVVELPGAALCSRGILGLLDVPADLAPEDPLADYSGDALVVTSEMREGAPSECQVFADPATRPEVAFRIRTARQRSLELGVPLGGHTLEAVRQCFPSTITFRIRTTGVYTVFGTASGFEHRVVAGEDGRCVVDPDVDPRRRGRAASGVVFRNTQVAFHIRDAAVPPGVALELQLDTSGVPMRNSLQLGVRPTGTVAVLPSSIAFSEINERLYVVDSANRGLLEIDPQPLRITRPFE